jgi:hypothetical protein
MAAYRFADELAWQTFWHSARRAQGPLPEALLHETALELEPHGFRLFRNGGLPLLDRRTGDFVEEILLVPGPEVEGGRSVNARVHVSSQRLREFRERYWQPASLAPAVLAGGDLGWFELPPAHAAWRVETERDVAELLSVVTESVLPWLEAFWELRKLWDAFENGGYPLLRPAVAVELAGALVGKGEGLRLLRGLARADSFSVDERARLLRMARTYGWVRPGSAATLFAL